jgi:N-acetylglucosaminyl-diphospho-decaprenol L-rhamnosyltransferase
MERRTVATPTPGLAPSDRSVGATAASQVAAVVVDYRAGDVLASCVASLLDEQVGQVIVVENGPGDGARQSLAAAGLGVPVVVPGRNLGYGAGANRGVAASGHVPYVLVCNPDLRVHPGAVGALVAALEARPAWAIVGPRIVTPEGGVYPSVRRFPSMADAAGHALLGLFDPDNRFSRRYRPPGVGGDEPAPADWVSGACFLIRRRAMEELGGFDESYFMFVEDMDLCWRARQAGWGVGVQPAATVTHLEGVSRRSHPYRMIVAHHRSAMRFAARATTGWRRAALPLAAAVLGARLVAACSLEALGRRGTGARTP